jgi:hypothetical protein
MGQVRRVSFVVRVVQDPRGRVRGIVERVATGSKQAFSGETAIGRVIVDMLRGDSLQRPGVRPRSLSDETPGAAE